jgi:SAM-dependent MidA family methyltransferase
MYSICHLLATTKQAQALIIDYGEDHAFNNSLRAIKNQNLFKDNDILSHTGECDLSCYVNFKALKRVIYNFPSLNFGGLMQQGDFLEILQLFKRFKELQKNANSTKQKQILERQFTRLVEDNEMGDIYKFLYIHKKNHKPVFPFIEEILTELDAEQKRLNNK